MVNLPPATAADPLAEPGVRAQAQLLAGLLARGLLTQSQHDSQLALVTSNAAAAASTAGLGPSAAGQHVSAYSPARCADCRCDPGPTLPLEPPTAWMLAPVVTLPAPLSTPPPPSGSSSFLSVGIEFYLMSLPGSTDRRTTMFDAFAALSKPPPHIVVAVDGKQIDDDPRAVALFMGVAAGGHRDAELRAWRDLDI